MPDRIPIIFWRFLYVKNYNVRFMDENRTSNYDFFRQERVHYNFLVLKRPFYYINFVRHRFELLG